MAAKELSSLRAMHEQAESRLTEHLRLQASNKQEYTRTKAGYDNLITENQEKIYALDQLTEEKSRISNDLTNLQNEYTSNNLLLVIMLLVFFYGYIPIELMFHYYP